MRPDRARGGKSFWEESLRTHAEMIARLGADREADAGIRKAARLAAAAMRAGRRLLICGNGGSAADSQHLATELVSRFYLERRALDALALTVDTSALTAIGNDYDFSRVFARQVEAYGRRGDVLLAISTSGNSGNVVEAAKTARGMGLKVVGLTGAESSALSRLSDVCIRVPSASTPRIQEAHILIGHALCEFVERELFGRARRAGGAASAA